MTVQSIEAPKPRKPVNRVNKQQALKLRIENKLTFKEIGKLQGVDQAAVYRSIKDLLPTSDTEIFKKHRGDILAKLQENILLSVNADDIKDASLLQKITANGILYDKERLERGQSTANIAYSSSQQYEVFLGYKRMIEAEDQVAAE